jgi:hypothetical protein
VSPKALRGKLDPGTSRRARCGTRCWEDPGEFQPDSVGSSILMDRTPRESSNKDVSNQAGEENP